MKNYKILPPESLNPKFSPLGSRRFLLYFILCTSYFIPNLKAQNIVPNSSFENKIQCPQHDNQFTGYVSNWVGGGGGVCYLRSDCSGYGVGVPSNELGHQYAHTGVAYTGLYTYMDSLISPTLSNYRGYIQDTLLNPLIGGTRYYVTFYVSLADTFKYACNNIGAYFSDSALVWSGYVKSYLHPQVSNDTAHNPLTDKVNWMKVSGSFTAAGGEQYIIIGNFVDDAHSDTVFVNSTGAVGYAMSSYYYIDDVIVSTDSTYADSLFTGVQEYKPNKPNANVYPNPANNLLNVAISLPKGELEYTMCLYNSEGNRVMCETLSSDISTFSINQLSSGMYYYRIIDSSGNLVKADKVTIIK